MSIQDNIGRLVSYGIRHGAIDPADRIYTVNSLAELFGEDDVTAAAEYTGVPADDDIDGILSALIEAGTEKGLVTPGSVTSSDLFDTKVMGRITPPPSVIRSKFASLYEKSPQDATDWFFELSKSVNYIRTGRVKKDEKWDVDTEYGRLRITINLSKPEKDPVAIAAAGKAKSSSYPKCQLCMENEGYAGRLDHPARQNHRIIPVKLSGEDWFLQYSPYVYYNEHCIVFNSAHVPMKISRKSFDRLLEFVEKFPHYFIGSNADLPIVGGSILSHDHFQGGNYTFAMAQAPVDRSFTVKGFEDVSCGTVKWPMSVIRISGADRVRLSELAEHILNAWRGYSDESAFIFAHTDGADHNTITPIARRRGELFELDLVLRNNITTAEHPLGVYHPHSELHHIKKENIGLIEVMGLAVLPSRLKKEMQELEQAMLTGEDLTKNETLSKHADWAEKIKKGHPELEAGNIGGILKDEIGKVFCLVLEHAGVYKRDEEGRKAFKRFTDSL